LDCGAIPPLLFLLWWLAKLCLLPENWPVRAFAALKKQKRRNSAAVQRISLPEALLPDAL
jgi:hypothetical protein